MTRKQPNYAIFGSKTTERWLSGLRHTLGKLIHPIVAVASAVATTLGFWLRGLPYPIILRAASHIFFVVPCAFLAKKMFEKTDKSESFRTLAVRANILNAVVAVLHSAFEILAVLVALWIIVDFTTTLREIFLIVGLVTLAHSTVDFFIAFALYLPLKRARLLQIYQ